MACFRFGQLTVLRVESRLLSRGWLKDYKNWKRYICTVRMSEPADEKSSS